MTEISKFVSRTGTEWRENKANVTDRHCRPVAAEAVDNPIVEQNALIGFVKDSDHILTLTAN